MKHAFLSILFALAMLSSCNRPTAPSDTDQQQGNPRAKPEASATDKSGKQPSGDQAGKDAHTQLPNGAKKQ